MPKTIHLITVDTEFSSHPEDIGVTGLVGGEEFGAARIASICNAYGIKATFFVDVYSYQRAYADLLRDTCLRVQDDGHDLQLHTHPDKLYDADRGYMALYSPEEQVEIIRHGMQVFHRWFGCAPVAHRAGDWGADEHTLAALAANGIPVDSSMFFGWPTCALRLTKGAINGPSVHRGVLEVPPTIFYIWGLGIFSSHRLVSTDGQPLGEIMRVVDKLERGQGQLVVSVFHSFSFLEWNARRTEYWVSLDEVRKFERFVRSIAEHPGAGSMTFSELYEHYQRYPADVLGVDKQVPHSHLRFLGPQLLLSLGARGRMAREGR
jgi:hypothetical protein